MQLRFVLKTVYSITCLCIVDCSILIDWMDPFIISGLFGLSIFTVFTEITIHFYSVDLEQMSRFAVSVLCPFRLPMSLL